MQSLKESENIIDRIIHKLEKMLQSDTIQNAMHERWERRMTRAAKILENPSAYQQEDVSWAQDIAAEYRREQNLNAQELPEEDEEQAVLDYGGWRGRGAETIIREKN